MLLDSDDIRFRWVGFRCSWIVIMFRRCWIQTLLDSDDVAIKWWIFSIFLMFVYVSTHHHRKIHTWIVARSVIICRIRIVIQCTWVGTSINCTHRSWYTNRYKRISQVYGIRIWYQSWWIISLWYTIFSQMCVYVSTHHHQKLHTWIVARSVVNICSRIIIIRIWVGTSPNCTQKCLYTNRYKMSSQVSTPSKMITHRLRLHLRTLHYTRKRWNTYRIPSFHPSRTACDPKHARNHFHMPPQLAPMLTDPPTIAPLNCHPHIFQLRNLPLNVYHKQKHQQARFDSLSDSICLTFFHHDYYRKLNFRCAT